MRFLLGRRECVFAVAFALVILPFAVAVADSGSGQSAEAVLSHDDNRENDFDRAPRFARSNYVWPHESGPYYGDVDVKQRLDSGTLSTSVGSFRLSEGAMRLPSALRTPNKLGEVSAQYFIVQLSRESVKAGSLDALRGALAASGTFIADYMRVNAYVAKLNETAMSAVREVPGVLAIEPYHAAFKLSPQLGRAPHADVDKALSTIYDLQLILFPGEDAGLIARQVEAAGGQVTRISLAGAVFAEVDRTRVADVAAIEGLRYIVEDMPMLAQDEKSTTTVQTGAYNQGAIPYHTAGVDGGGDSTLTSPVSEQILMVLDTGMQFDSGEFSDDRDSAGTPGVSHRKVLFYGTTIPFGGQGDMRGCDAFSSGSFTHGQVVSATAIGRASDVDPSVYCPLAGPGQPCGYFAFDTFDAKPWKLDGVAPGGLLVFYDAQVNNGVNLCTDPLLNVNDAAVNVGTLYAGGTSGSMGNAYGQGALVFNLSFGSTINEYDIFAQQVDTFLNDKKDAMAFAAAGNDGDDINPANNIPDERLIGAPATMKNGISVGSSFATSDLNLNGNEESRSFVSGVGPVQGTGEICAANNVCAGGRIQPTVMAPGVDVVNGALGPSSNFYCVSETNDNTDPVQCDVKTSKASTSFATGAASGAAMLVRDYFEQGFLPDGTKDDCNNDADQVSAISGALVKAALVASTDFLNGGLGGNLSADYRPNPEQGWGRIQLDNVLPLSAWAGSATGLIVVDGGISGGVKMLGTGGGNVNGTANPQGGSFQESSFEVCDANQELRVALAWVEGQGISLQNDLDLEIESPGGRIYLGNYSTDDDDRNGATDPVTEDCPNPFIANPQTIRDAAEWNLPACTRGGGAGFSPTDVDNPVETVILSPDYERDGDDDLNPDDDNQIELGTWLVRVIGSGGNTTTQGYAVVLSGGVCQGSSAQFDEAVYACNALAAVTVSEFDETSDPCSNLTPAEIAGRTSLEVRAPNNDCDRDGSPDAVPCDSEAGAAFTWSQVGRCTITLPGEPGPRSCVTNEDCSDIGAGNCDMTACQFVAEEVLLTDGTVYDTGNGALDVQNDDSVVVVYKDEDNGSPACEKERESVALVDCEVKLGVGTVTFNQFGQDFNYFVNGGCEKSPRDLFYQGYPDKHMDAGESLVLNYGFTSNEGGTLTNAEVSLRCVDVDTDSPESCPPGSDLCSDPDRKNNPPCGGGTPYMTIYNSPMVIGQIPQGAGLSANFNIQMANAISGEPVVELVFEIKAQTSGKTASGVQVNRLTLDVDEANTFYSTDYPMGGSDVVFDYNGDEQVSDPLTVVGEGCPPNCAGSDGRFETRQFASLQVGGKNTDIASPWAFDVNNGNFRSGLNATSDEANINDIITNWGEDRNFNGFLDWNCSTGAQSSCGTNGQKDDPDPCPGRGEGICQSVEDANGNESLDQNWSTLGGCGWQTRAPGVCSGDSSFGCYTTADCTAVGQGTCNTGGGGQPTGGVWHTGTIDSTSVANCIEIGATAGQCQFYETVSGTTGALRWTELLITPEVEKVNGDDYAIEITQFGWNLQIDLADNRAFYLWEFDTDTTSLEPVDLFGDRIELNSGFGSACSRRWRRTRPRR
jgi:hypothetical protein